MCQQLQLNGKKATANSRCKKSFCLENQILKLPKPEIQILTPTSHPEH
jgi:hypothetical protein